MASVPDIFVKQTREVLTHFYDYAYLLQHPLVQRVQAVHGEEGMGAVHELRRMVLERVEALKPSPDIPSTDPAWRPYQSLHQRYVLGKGLSQTGEEMGLGKRQVQREQRKGVEALAAMLWEVLLPQEALPPPGTTPRGDDALLHEIGRGGFANEEFDAVAQVQEALLSLRALAQNRGVPLHWAGDDAPMYVAGNPSLFRQLVIIAASCLLKLESVWTLSLCLERGAAEGRLSLAARTDRTVRPDEVELPQSLRTLADAEGIEVTSERAKGGFRLCLDLPMAQDFDTLCVDNDVATQGIKKATVAIVEDNEDLLTLFSRYLALRGHSVIEVTDSTTAQERLLAIAPDVVVLDIMMPQVDGWELLRQLRAEPRLQHVPIIVCSVLDEPELADALGAARYLRKPVRPPALFRAISEVLEG
ncbi:MAG: response regulator [Chloroflexota bacterium]|nr:response regulator [Chloroflexota bacterium]